MLSRATQDTQKAALQCRAGTHEHSKRTPTAPGMDTQKVSALEIAYSTSQDARQRHPKGRFYISTKSSRFNVCSFGVKDGTAQTQKQPEGFFNVLRTQGFLKHGNNGVPKRLPSLRDLTLQV